MRAEVIDAGNPVDIHGLFLHLRIFAAKALDLDDQIEKIALAVAILASYARYIGADAMIIEIVTTYPNPSLIAIALIGVMLFSQLARLTSLSTVSRY